MPHADNLQGVIDGSLCIGCGACVFADPSVSIALHPDKLIFEPTSPGGPDAAAVCPAVEVDFFDLQQRVFPGAETTEYGVVDSVFLAQSTDYDRNFGASSGGLIKEVLIQLLESGQVDAVIALGEVEGLDYQPRLIRSVEEVDGLPGSIYHNLAQPEAIRLIEDTDARLALVAIPCQLEGIYKYIFTMRPELADRIAITIGLICGWQYNHHSIRAICEYKGVDPDTIEHISYRGGGPVGKLTIQTSDGRTTTASRRVDFGYQVAFDRHFNTPRCHLCVNHSNFLADIVVGDAWLPATLTTKTGISLVICRTQGARKLLDELRDRERVVYSEVTTEEIRESQKDRVVFGEFAYAYREYLEEIGAPFADLRGPNRERANLRPRSEVVHFHRELERKSQLMRQRRYRYLKWRKATKELRSFLSRYLNWFLVRVLRIKSLTGKREEVPREKMSVFR
jgi:coenzyme F420-reducing hydrogenase beta subunit